MHGMCVILMNQGSALNREIRDILNIRIYKPLYFVMDGITFSITILLQHTSLSMSVFDSVNPQTFLLAPKLKMERRILKALELFLPYQIEVLRI